MKKEIRLKSNLPFQIFEGIFFKRFFSTHNYIAQGIPDYRFQVSRLVKPAVTSVFLAVTRDNRVM